jgi:hypothetical protein
MSRGALVLVQVVESACYNGTRLAGIRGSFNKNGGPIHQSLGAPDV